MAHEKPETNVEPIKGAHTRRWLNRLQGGNTKAQPQYHRIIVEGALIALFIFIIVLGALTLVEASLLASVKDFGAGLLSANMDWMLFLYLATLLAIVSLGFAFRKRLRLKTILREIAGWGVIAVVLALVFVFWTRPATRFFDRDCADFSTRSEAQRFFQAAGPGDPHNLDDDGDGRACELLL